MRGRIPQNAGTWFDPHPAVVVILQLGAESHGQAVWHDLDLVLDEPPVEIVGQIVWSEVQGVCGLNKNAWTSTKVAANNHILPR